MRVQRVHTLPDAVQGGLAIDEGCIATQEEYLLSIPGVARFHVLHGREVRFLPEHGAHERDIRIYLLGSIFGVLCHQNGFLPLHASAVATHDGVTAFLADSGAGKSTLAAFLGRQGFPVIADDICLLQPDATGELRIVPVGGWLKLWRGSLNALGESATEEQRVVSNEDKYRFYLDPKTHRRQDAPTPLNRLIFLERPAADSTDSKPVLTALPPPVALAQLMDATYNAYLLHRLGLERRLFRQCAQVVAHAGAYRLLAPWGFETMPAVIATLTQELRGDMPD